MKNNSLGLKARIRSFGFALKGLKVFIRDEANAKIQLFAAFLAVVFGIAFEISSLEWLMVSLAISIVIILEIINSAIEGLVDLVQPEFDPRAGKIKDLAAASVLVGAIFAALVGLIVFLNPIVELISRWLT
jgi:diacylglycerol kinase (ATP)